MCCVGIVVRQANMFSGECSSKRVAVHFSSFESCDFFFSDFVLSIVCFQQTVISLVVAVVAALLM